MYVLKVWIWKKDTIGKKFFLVIKKRKTNIIITKYYIYLFSKTRIMLLLHASINYNKPLQSQ